MRIVVASVVRTDGVNWREFLALHRLPIAIKDRS
jgi:hypothetical protein